MPENRLSIGRFLIASAGVVMACAVLGGFGSCNLGMLQGPTGGPGVIVFGTVAGLLCGLAVSFWDKSRAQQPAPVGRRFVLRFAYATGWLLVAALSFGSLRLRAPQRIPVRIPIRFDTKNTVSATFIADFDAYYDVQLDLKRKLPLADLQAFVAPVDPSAPPAKTAKKGPARPEIVWTVSNERDDDKSVSWDAVSWGETIGLQIGRFYAEAGRRYTVTAQVVKPSAAAQVLDPYLQIVQPEDSAPYMTTSFVTMGGVIAGFIGSVLLILSLLNLLAERQESRKQE